MKLIIWGLPKFDIVGNYVDVMNINENFLMKNVLCDINLQFDLIHIHI